MAVLVSAAGTLDASSPPARIAGADRIRCSPGIAGNRARATRGQKDTRVHRPSSPGARNKKINDYTVRESSPGNTRTKTHTATPSGNGHEYLCCHAFLQTFVSLLLRTNAHILRLPFELKPLADIVINIIIIFIRALCRRYTIVCANCYPVHATCRPSPLSATSGAPLCLSIISRF